MSISKTYKTKYTEEELQGLYAWFRERMDRLPSQIQLDKSTKVDDVPFYVRSIMGRMNDLRQSPSLNGYYAYLLTLRERLEEEGMA